MEIQPSRQHLPDRFGPLSPCIAPGPEGLDRQPIRQHLLPPAAYAASGKSKIQSHLRIIFLQSSRSCGYDGYPTAPYSTTRPADSDYDAGSATAADAAHG